MKRYSGLFEDEVSSLLRELPLGKSIKMNNRTTYVKRDHMVNDDGIVSKVEDFAHYVNDKYVGAVNRTFMIQALCHTNFEIE